MNKYHITYTICTSGSESELNDSDLLFFRGDDTANVSDDESEDELYEADGLLYLLDFFFLCSRLCLLCFFLCEDL